MALEIFVKMLYNIIVKKNFYLIGNLIERAEFRMKKKYYAVRKGRVTGILNSWDECKRSVIGFTGAEYKGFTDYEEARIYLDGGMAAKRDVPDMENLQDGEAVAYVDGSYNVKTKVFSFGAVLFTKDGAKQAAKAFDDPELAAMRNVAGEILGAMYAMNYCVKTGIKRLALYYDYEGIEKWCTGAWKANKAGTAAYKSFYDGIKDDMEVIFVKVKGHSGDKYNDVVDVLAKKAAGVIDSEQ